MPRISAQETAESLLTEAIQMGLQPKENNLSKTGYEGVIEVKDKYQGRLYDKARRKQRAVPGLHSTALEAALALARAKQVLADSLEDGETFPSPVKRKSRVRKQHVLPVAMALPMDAVSPRGVGLSTPMATPMANVPNATPLMS